MCVCTYRRLCYYLVLLCVDQVIIGGWFVKGYLNCPRCDVLAKEHFDITMGVAMHM